MCLRCVGWEVSALRVVREAVISAARRWRRHVPHSWCRTRSVISNSHLPRHAVGHLRPLPEVSLLQRAHAMTWHRMQSSVHMLSHLGQMVAYAAIFCSLGLCWIVAQGSVVGSWISLLSYLSYGSFVQSGGSSSGVLQLALGFGLPSVAEALARVVHFCTRQVALMADLWPSGFWVTLAVL